MTTAQLCALCLASLAPPAITILVVAVGRLRRKVAWFEYAIGDPQGRVYDRIRNADKRVDELEEENATLKKALHNVTQWRKGVRQ